MKYVPYYELNDTPNIIVDGGANAATRLTLSHWPHSGTPWPLKQDLSAEIVFKYLDTPEFQIEVEAVSNNHFDEDGLISLFAILKPHQARAARELLIDIASAGDFSTYHLPDAARIAFTIAAFGNAGTSPLPSRIFDRPYPETTAGLYVEMLERLPAILEEPQKFRQYWEKEERWLQESEEHIHSGRIQISEVPAIDLAIATIPEGVDCHPMAMNNKTSCFRILFITGRQYEFKYRYETWVQYVSRPVVPRVDLTPLAERLSQQDVCRWTFDGVESIVPSLYPEDSSNLPPEKVRGEIQSFLAAAPSAWDPFDPRSS